MGLLALQLAEQLGGQALRLLRSKNAKINQRRENMTDVLQGEIETVEDQQSHGEPMPSRPTRRDLAERGVDVLDTSQMRGRVSAVGVDFKTMVEVLDFAKLMATSGKLVPKYLRGNAGGCLGITFQAIEWRMSPFQVANKSYEVNDRIAYESQLIHAVIEARAPLQHRLDCTYAGELIYDEREVKDTETGETYTVRVLNWRKSTRTCTVIGQFVNGDVREYTTPKLSDIRIKNSPLWRDDPDQQLFYYGSRSWSRKWCPDVTMGLYSPEEMEMRPDRDEEAGLHARLVGSPPSSEGHKAGHVESELDQVSANVKTPAAKAASPPVSEATPARGNATPRAAKRASDVPRAKAGKRQKDTPANEGRTMTLVKPSDLPSKARVKAVADRAEARGKGDKGPSNVKEYLAYAKAWIKGMDDAKEIDARWMSERKMRNDLGVTADDRAPLDELRADRIAQLTD
jgi:hypothetical protein